MNRFGRGLQVVVALLGVALVVSGVSCGRGSKTTSDPAVGDMSNTSYSNGRGKAYGPNAEGDEVALDMYEGDFVWVDYEGPWCSACSPQSKVMSKLDKELGDEIVFITVMTSDSKPFSESTRKTAASWARRHKLEPSRVVAEGLSTRTVPQHAFFSPSGHTLYRETGTHTADKIRLLIKKHKGIYADWKAANSP